MRKLFGLIVTGLFVASVTVACSSSPGSSSPTAPSTSGTPPQADPSTPVPAPPTATTNPPTQVPSPTTVPVAEPKRLQIPSIGVDAAVEYVGLAEDGSMDVPKDPTEVAWYKLGPKPGENGNAVIAGHVDWGGKVMPFWGLKDLKAGDTVTVIATDGKKYDFAVESSKWYTAEGAPVEEVFKSSSTPEITLITCGGTFDRVHRQYLDRLVVRAKQR